MFSILTRTLDVYMWNMVALSTSFSGSMMILNFLTLKVLIKKLYNVQYLPSRLATLNYAVPVTSFQFVLNNFKQACDAIIIREVSDRETVYWNNRWYKAENASIQRNNIPFRRRIIYVLHYWVLCTNRQNMRPFQSIHVRLIMEPEEEKV